MIIAVDFDGTLVTHKFPNIGEELPFAVNVLKELKNRNNKVFLWTMRGHPDCSKFPNTIKGTDISIKQDTLQEAIKWCQDRGLELDGVNISPSQFSTSNKQYAHIYIDDAAIGCPIKYYASLKEFGVDWYKIAEFFVVQGLLDKKFLRTLKNSDKKIK